MTSENATSAGILINNPSFSDEVSLLKFCGPNVPFIRNKDDTFSDEVSLLSIRGSDVPFITNKDDAFSDKLSLLSIRGSNVPFITNKDDTFSDEISLLNIRGSNVPFITNKDDTTPHLAMKTNNVMDVNTFMLVTFEQTLFIPGQKNTPLLHLTDTE